MRGIAVFGVAAFIAAGPAVADKKPKLPDELVLSGDNIIDIVIEGQPYRLEVRPEAPEAPMVNPHVAEKLKFKPGVIGFGAIIGPEKVMGTSAVHRVDYGVGEKKQRLFWADRDSSTVADGIISPASLPYKRVRFVFSEPRSGEIVRKLPLDNFGFLGRLGVGTTVKLLDENMQVQFSLERDEALVSAPTGNWLAQNRDGKFTGPATSTLISYGIKRPTRPMRLASPIELGSFALAEIDVRVSDFGDATGISEMDAPVGDSEEIVVVGKKDRDINPRITIGRRFFNGCSNLLYDFDKREILISCNADSPTASGQ